MHLSFSVIHHVNKRARAAAVWQKYLVLKTRCILEKGEAAITCIARSLPKAFGLVLLDKLQSCGGRLFGAKEGGFVTLYLWSDPDPMHELFLGFFATQFTFQCFIATGEITVVTKLNDLESH